MLFRAEANKALDRTEDPVMQLRQVDLPAGAAERLARQLCAA
jgi:hypothetical protein